ncbi:Pol polyprotein [Plakobranchus ocellatus]|uniref:Pol polyprotein n=1 Tax=Plakobranchus ocellatus TaxID=259542 RepID=A0AAV4B1W6_9GAST|nr:Pol polyprotein [Plakobranchus ocellatus]
MAAAQTSSADVHAYNTALTNLQITSTKLNDQGPEHLCCISTGRARPIVPPDFRRSVFEAVPQWAVHNLSHPGVKATVKLVSEKFVWHGLRRQVSTWVKKCHECQSSKIRKHTCAPLQTFTVPEKRFSHNNIDIVGPLPESCGYRYLITVIDRNTRWPEAIPIPIPNITTAECVQALVGEITRRLGVKVHPTTAFHPQANGMVERFHRTLKAALKARLTGKELPWVLLELRTAPREDLGYSSAELVYSEPVTIPGEFTPSQLRLGRLQNFDSVPSQDTTPQI